MPAQKQKPVAFAAEGLHLAFLSIATAESGIIEHGTCRFSYAIHLLKLRGRSNVKIFVGKIASDDWLSPLVCSFSSACLPACSAVSPSDSGIFESAGTLGRPASRKLLRQH